VYASDLAPVFVRVRCVVRYLCQFANLLGAMHMKECHVRIFGANAREKGEVVQKYVLFIYMCVLLSY
jgi:hypothetical protein